MLVRRNASHRASHCGRRGLHIRVIRHPGPAQQRRATREILLRSNPKPAVASIHRLLCVRNFFADPHPTLPGSHRRSRSVRARLRSARLWARTALNSSRLVNTRVDLPDRLWRADPPPPARRCARPCRRASRSSAPSERSRSLRVNGTTGAMICELTLTMSPGPRTNRRCPR